MPPRIGFTSREADFAYFLQWQRDYWFSILLAGGEPVRLTPDAVGDFEAALAGLDGLLLTGGGDIDPAQYGQVMAGTDPASIYPERDRLELGLTRAAFARGLPTLGVCRGIQVMNVALGGSLIQHHDNHTGDANTFNQPRPHPVQIAPGTLLDRTLACGPLLHTNSYHHQALSSAGLAPGLIASAHALDGIIEAIESPDHPWFLGVQWHPERQYELGPEHGRLFQALVAASR